jgi:uncharacterized protein YjbI with pentapeptide repeats
VPQDSDRLIRDAPKRDGRPVLQAASFEGSFDGPVSFENVIFEGPAWFAYCTFEDAADFRGATFSDAAGFTGVTFRGPARFDGAEFRGVADFQDTTWTHGADFVRTSFAGDVRFMGPTEIHGDARFDMATFGGAVWAPPRCRGELWFDRAQFEAARYLGPVIADGRVVLDGAVFTEHVALTLRAPALSAGGTEFRSGTDILLQSATVALDGAGFGAPSTLGSATRDTALGALLADEYDAQTIPRVVSRQGARVANLTLAGVDLRACRFRGAHGLDAMTLSQVVFAETPRSWRYARRLALAEEHRWRTEGQRTPGWWTEELRTAPATPNWREPDTPTPHQVAAIYRALRKAQEARYDAPGAADFYYGEMEMRRLTRHDTGTADDGAVSPGQAPAALPLSARSRQDSTRRVPTGEAAVLWLYWLVSGYGLRASRALLALFVTVVLGAILLAAFGFPRVKSFGDALIFSLESSVSLLRAPSEPLTSAGELITIGLRLLGPLFFGLALLALRGRVKR